MEPPAPVPLFRGLQQLDAWPSWVPSSPPADRTPRDTAAVLSPPADGRPRVIPALTITQPWATLIAHGYKRIETRSWGTLDYRGPLAIHAAKTFPLGARIVCLREPFLGCLREIGIESADQLPTGKVLAVALLTDCLRVADDRSNLPTIALSSREQSFGDLGPGRFLWVLDDIDLLDAPVPAKGKLGIWDWQWPDDRED